MTTAVTVDATSHDVEVHRLDAKTDQDIMPVEIVKKGDKIVFYAHQGQNILIKEVRDDASG